MSTLANTDLEIYGSTGTDAATDAAPDHRLHDRGLTTACRDQDTAAPVPLDPQADLSRLLAGANRWEWCITWQITNQYDADVFAPL
ncbi:MAG: hypothetical protein R2838_15355 [Caldilineaceae bacterium]